MSASVDPLAILGPERRLSGATLAFLAFVMGTLFALLPMYYVYTLRDSATPTIPLSTAAAPAVVGQDSGTRERSAETSTSARFAARMTYELSHTPAEPPPAAVRVVAKAEPVAAAPSAPASPLQRAEAVPRVGPAPRGQNARPIIAAPLDARDTTREMEKEARRPEYREAPRQLAQAGVEPVQPRVIEGRDFVLPAKPVPTRPIAAAEGDAAKRADATAASAATARATVASVTVVEGATPIGRPPEAKPEPQKSKPDAAPASGDVLGSRLSATREWLATAAQTTHTIQLMGTSSEEQLRNHLKALGKVLEPGKIYVIRTLAQGKPAMTVLYGAYADRQAALQALGKLPAAVAANRPVLRTVNGIRTEQKQHGIDS
jgi:septal ring-binding cell division protein DamX